jgi:hypothetical protein
MALNIQRFMSNMSQKPSARSSHFDVIITSKIGGNSDLTLRAENVSLPGRSVSTTDFFDVGPPRKMGYSAVYLESAISFILSDDYNEKEYFDKWTDVIVGPHRTKRSPGGDRYNAGYYDDYKGTVEIWNYDENSRVTYKTKLIEAWPSIISPVQLDWGSSDFAKLNVTFAYRYYEQRDMAEENLLMGGLQDGAPNSRTAEIARQNAAENTALMTGGLQDTGSGGNGFKTTGGLSDGSGGLASGRRSAGGLQDTGTGRGVSNVRPPHPTFPKSTVNHTT